MKLWIISRLRAECSFMMWVSYRAQCDHEQALPLSYRVVFAMTEDVSLSARDVRLGRVPCFRL